MTQTHCNTQPVSKVPVQAAQMACAPGRETGVRDADGGYRGEGRDWEGPSLNTRLRFLNALRLINGNVGLSSFFLCLSL